MFLIKNIHGQDIIIFAFVYFVENFVSRVHVETYISAISFLSNDLSSDFTFKTLNRMIWRMKHESCLE